MTIFDKIEVKFCQFITLSLYILLSKRWFAWVMKLPVFALATCVWVIARPYEWTYVVARTHHLIATDEFYELADWIEERVHTEKFEDIIDIFY